METVNGRLGALDTRVACRFVARDPGRAASAGGHRRDVVPADERIRGEDPEIVELGLRHEQAIGRGPANVERRPLLY